MDIGSEGDTMKNINDSSDLGYTLIETAIALGLISIVAMMLMSVFIGGMSHYEMIADDEELRFQAQYVTDFVTCKIRESRCVTRAAYNTESYMNTKAEWVQVNKLSVGCGAGSESYLFELKEPTNKIFYGKGSAYSSATSELGCYISAIYVGSAVSDVALRDADTIKIKLCFKKGKEERISESTVYMRNSQKSG